MRSNKYFLKMSMIVAAVAVTGYISEASATIIERRIRGGQVSDGRPDQSNNDAEQHLGFEDSECPLGDTCPPDPEVGVNLGGMEGNRSSDLELGTNRPPPHPAAGEPGNGQQLIGLRWLNMTIPQGATITNAWIQFTTDEPDKDTGLPNNDPSPQMDLRITGELGPTVAYDDGIAFNITDRTDTAASVDWIDIPRWATNEIIGGGIQCVGCGLAGPDQKTPDLTTILQEIVNQGSFLQGDSIALMLLPLTIETNRTARSWESNDSNDPNVNQSPLLHIEFVDVPEPTSLAIVTMGLMGLLTVRRRRS